MGLIDKAIAAISPTWALKRELSRVRLDHLSSRAYDAAKPSNYHRNPGTSRSGDGVMDHARESIRDLARHLDENHDLAIGILDDLVNNVVGPNGITVEPQIKTKGGKLNDRANKIMRNAWIRWQKKAEVTQSMPFGEMQRLLCRSWFRDGEILIQHVKGRNGYQYPGRIPYALELIEADFLPFDLTQQANPKIVHGIEMDAWRKPAAYHLYLEHPNDRIYYTGLYKKTKRVNADLITHLKFSRRVNQARGVSVLHGVINRLDDLKDYEESERIAARVAAAFTGYIKKSPDFAGNQNTDAADRSFTMESGMIFDNLMPGEEIGTIDSNRPNAGVEDFRNGQLRAVAGGVGSRYSSIAKDYNGTYSSQRQELVEAQPSYEKLRNYFIYTAINDIYANFVTMAIASGAVALPRNIDQESLFDFEARGQGMTWIDPKKEIEADALAVQHRFKSRRQVIRDRGGDPAVVDEQLELELEYDEKKGFGASVAKSSDDDPTKEQAGESEESNNGGGDEESNDKAANA